MEKLVQILVSLFTSFVYLDKLPNLSEPQFPPLKNNNTYITILQGLNEICSVEICKALVFPMVLYRCES